MTAKKIFSGLLLTAITIAFFSLFLAIVSIANASSFDNKDAQSVYFKAGDTVVLPNRKGNFIMLLWGGGEPVWYNPTTEWFQYEPIRNYSTVYLDITRMIPEGDYQFVEIDANGSDPYNVRSWQWLREFKVHVNKCDGFKLC